MWCRFSAWHIGPQGRHHHVRIAAAALGAGHCEAITEAVHRLRINRAENELSFDQRLDGRDPLSIGLWADTGRPIDSAMGQSET